MIASSCPGRREPVRAGLHLAVQAGLVPCAIPVERVDSAFHLVPLEAAPALSKCFSGYVELDGRRIPVADLCTLLGLPPGPRPRACIVIVSISAPGSARLLGLIVDEIPQLIAFPPERLNASPGGTAFARWPTLGTAELDRVRIPVLDVEALLGPELPPASWPDEPDLGLAA